MIFPQSCLEFMREIEWSESSCNAGLEILVSSYTDYRAKCTDSTFYKILDSTVFTSISCCGPFCCNAVISRPGWGRSLRYACAPWVSLTLSIIPCDSCPIFSTAPVTVDTCGLKTILLCGPVGVDSDAAMPQIQSIMMSPAPPRCSCSGAAR